MKKVIFGITSLVFVFLIIYYIVPTIIINDVKSKVIEKNSGIENIVTINQTGAWGEWFLEFVLVVEIDGQPFRIWVDRSGDITDKEQL
ncbi:MAG TPA: hypothetical protein VIH12_00550 [Solibacillus sp.]